MLFFCEFGGREWFNENGISRYSIAGNSEQNLFNDPNGLKLKPNAQTQIGSLAGA
jgi:hypothetical protein